MSKNHNERNTSPVSRKVWPKCLVTPQIEKQTYPFWESNRFFVRSPPVITVNTSDTFSRDDLTHRWHACHVTQDSSDIDFAVYPPKTNFHVCAHCADLQGQLQQQQNLLKSQQEESVPSSLSVVGRIAPGHLVIADVLWAQLIEQLVVASGSGMHI